MKNCQYSFYSKEFTLETEWFCLRIAKLQEHQFRKMKALMLRPLEYIHKEEKSVNRIEEKKQRPYLRMYLYTLRTAVGLSIYAVTRNLFLSKPYYYQIEQGVKGHKMDVIFLFDLARVLKTDFETLCKKELEYQRERRALGIRKDRRWVMEDEV